MRCENCGQEIREGSQFCLNCGALAPVEKKSETTTKKSSPTAKLTVFCVVAAVVVVGISCMMLNHIGPFAPANVVISNNSTNASVNGSAAVGESSNSEASVVVVPDLSKMSPADAREALESVGLFAQEGEPVNSTSVEAGYVRKQDPAAGAEVTIGTTVTYQLSIGPATSSNDAKKAEYESQLAGVDAMSTSGMSMAEMAQLGSDKYNSYKDLLDSVYQYYLGTLSGSARTALETEQAEWTSSRDAAIKAVSDNFQGASGFALSMECSSKGMEYTRARIVELLARF